MLDPVVPFTIAEALRPIRGAFLVVRKRHVGRRIRIDFFFFSKSKDVGRDVKKKEKNCRCCRSRRGEDGGDCERRLTRRLKMFAKSRETGAEEVERYLLRCYS